MSIAAPVRTGTGTIAEVYDLGHAYRLVTLSIGFTRVASSGSETAAIAIRRQGRHQDDLFDIACHPAIGVGSDVWVRVDPDLMAAYQFGATDKLKIDWTTPDGTNIGWVIRMHWEPV